MKTGIFIICFVFVSILVQGQKNYAALIDQYVSAYAKAYDFHGAVVVSKGRDVIYRKAFGFGNREWKVPNTVDTRFPVASLTKQFTAAAILRLAEEGKISLRDRLSKFFPVIEKSDSISIHMLLNHTSGLREYSRDPQKFRFASQYSGKTLRDSTLKIFAQMPFDFSPGTYWRYSNTGYILLGYIIEEVTGKSYNDFIRQNILLPAGMKNSGVFRTDSVVEKRAYGYVQTPKNLIAVKGPAFSIGAADGGLHSTVEDLLIWHRALNDGKIINAVSLKQMNTPNHEQRGAGYGIFVDRFFDQKVIFHTGNIPGFSSSMIHYPDSEVFVAVLANRETNLDFLPKGIAGILFNKDVTLPAPHRPISLSAESLKRYEGNFQTPFPFSVKEKSGQLFLSIGRDVPLLPVSKTKFYVDEQDVALEVEYIVDKYNQVVRTYLIEGGVRTEAKRKTEN
jgi:CubicO group peptidase (beta-lactamase class C family)